MDNSKHREKNVSYRAPFSWTALREFLNRIPFPLLERVEGNAIVRLLNIEDRLVKISIDSKGQLQWWGRASQDEVEPLVGEVFELDCTIRGRLQQHKGAEWLGEAVGLPILRYPDTFAALVTTVLEQQTNWKAATGAIHSLLLASHRKAYGLALFPTPEQLVNDPTPVEQLLVTHRRKAIVLELARRFLDEPGYLDDHCYSLAEAEKRLLSLKGIGPWTARVFLSKRFGYRALVPLNDVALQRAAAWFIKGEKGKLSPLELEEALSPFGELAGEAAHRILMRWVLETY